MRNRSNVSDEINEIVFIGILDVKSELWFWFGCSHGGHGLVLEGDKGHAQRLGVDLLLLLPVLLLQLGLPLGVVAHSLLL